MYQNKIIKRLLFVFLFLLVLGLVGLEIMARLYREKAGAYFREQFNKQSELVLDPFTTSISVWKHFPRITFSFGQVSLLDTVGKKPVRVLFVKRAEIAIPLGQFRLNRLQINRLALENVVFYEQVDSSGTKAGLRFREIENPDTTAGRLPFEIPTITIRNGLIKSQNFYKKSSYAFRITKGDLAARLQNGQLKLTGKINGRIGHIHNNRKSMFRNLPYSLNLRLNYLLNQKQIRFSNTYLILNQDSIYISGRQTRLRGGKGANLNLTLKGRQPLLYVFKQVLPAPVQPFLHRINTNSRMLFTYRLTGISGPTTTPQNTIQFALQNGQLYLPETKTTVRNVNFVGDMTNGDLHKAETSSLKIKEFTARTRQGNMRVQLQVQNFIRPYFTINGQGGISLTELAGLVQLPLSQVTAGAITGNFNFKGTLPDTLQKEPSDWQGDGNLQVQQASFRPVGLTVNCRQVNGSLRFNSNLLQLQNLSGNIGGKPFRLSASIQNYLAYLFQSPGAIGAQANIYVAQLDADWLNLDEMTQEDKNTSAAKRPKGATKALNNLERATMQVNLQVAQVNLPGQKQLNNLAVQVNQRGPKVKLTRMQFTTNGGGQASASGEFHLTNAGIQNPYLQVKLHYPFINLQRFMLDLAAVKRDATAPAPAKTASAPSKKNFYFKENDYLLKLHLTATRLEYLYLKGSNLNLQANLNRHRVKLAQLRVNAVGGQINVRGEMQLDALADNLPVQLRAQASNINLQRLFTLAENMKLDVLSSQNIKGTANCNLNVSTTLDNTFSPSFAGTVAYAQARFKNMELIQVEPIQNALRFLSKERTGHLYFEDVNTSFIMKDTIFITPRLPLNSNLAAFEMSGTYIMGGEANLHMDIRVLNVLFGNNKRRIEKIQSDSMELDTDGRKQHLLISREGKKYKVKLNNRRSREDSRQALQQTFKQYLRQHQIDTVFTMNR